MSAVCPACGVAVVPGYVKCPKCHAALPHRAGRLGNAMADPGGTTIKESGFPIAPVLIAIAVAGGIALLFGLRGGDKPEQVTLMPPRPPQVEQQPDPVVAPSVPTSEPAPPAGPSPTAVASDLDRALKKQRLWGTVQVFGPRVDVRSGACSDPGMAPLLDAAREPLRSAGLTRLRCLEQSGSIVFERDL